nr:hypothetical protein [Tanacetum cinerariifolium]
MLAPSGEGLILYQAYGNLYAMIELHVTWAHLEKKQTRLRTYTNISQDYVLSSWRRHHIFYVTPSQRIPRRRHKNPGGQVVEKFFGQGEQVLQVPDKNDEKNDKGTSEAKEKLKEELGLTLMVRRLYIERYSGKEGSRVRLVPVDQEGKDVKLLVDQVEGNRESKKEGAKRYKLEVMDATAPFHRFRITYLSKAQNQKTKALTRLASIQLGFLNQEVSVGIKTRPSIETPDKVPEETKKATLGKLSSTWGDHSGST